MSDYLTTYMAYSRAGGSQEGAVLVFAHTYREAHALVWQAISYLTDTFTDLALKRIRDSPWLFLDAKPELLARDEAHVVDNPTSCKNCCMWGQGPIGVDGLCPDCREGNDPE